MTLGAGDVLAGRYRLERKLGSGGMGTVWAAEHLALRGPVAVKLLAAEVAEDPAMHRRFVAEARAAANIRGAHVVQVFDFGVENGAPYIVMELLEGESLGDRLRRDGPVPFADAVKFIGHVCAAMTSAHSAGIVHRDLKPDNVFIVREQADYAKVLDFGIAKVVGEDALSVRASTDSCIAMGTPFYLSPEQARDSRDVDYRSDLWALGVIAYECVTGKRPFWADNFGELLLHICVSPLPVPSKVSSVPYGFDEWFEKAVQRERSARFQSADELRQGLESILDGSPPVAEWRASIPAANAASRDTQLASIHVSYRASEAASSLPQSPSAPSGTMTSVSLASPAERRVIEVQGTSAVDLRREERRSQLPVYGAGAVGVAMAAALAWLGSRDPAPTAESAKPVVTSSPAAAPQPERTVAEVAPPFPETQPSAAPAPSAPARPERHAVPSAEPAPARAREGASPALEPKTGVADDPRFGGRR